jgi:hypothetical protein
VLNVRRTGVERRSSVVQQDPTEVVGMSTTGSNNLGAHGANIPCFMVKNAKVIVDPPPVTQQLRGRMSTTTSLSDAWERRT